MPIALGTSSTYAVLANTTITNTGASVLTGNVGIYPATGSSVTGFPPGTYTGTLNAGNAAAQTAKADAQAAYNACVALIPTTTLSASTYVTTNNQTLTAGTYAVGTSLQINGNLNLSGDGNSQFVFQIGSTLTTASSATITLVGGVNPCNIFWQVGSSATIGTSTVFKGFILANTSITCTTSASFTSGLFALTGAVTLDTNAVTNPCVCYAKGTKILTKDGYKKIEDIRVGDDVVVFGDLKIKEGIELTNGDETKKVTFVGYFTRDVMDSDSKPVVFAKDVLGPNIPSEDVMVSPNHGVIFNKYFIWANAFLNLTPNIYRAESLESITYYHIELEEHSIICASGMMGESMADGREKLTSL